MRTQSFYDRHFNAYLVIHTLAVAGLLTALVMS